MSARPPALALALAALALALAAGASRAALAGGVQRQSPFVVRPFVVTDGERWLGDAIAYGPHRDGQRPGESSPTVAQVREDLAILAKHWRLIRIYGAAGTGDTVLAAIRASRLPVKVVLGLWLAAEDRRGATGEPARTESDRAARARASGSRGRDLGGERDAGFLVVQPGDQGAARGVHPKGACAHGCSRDGRRRLQLLEQAREPRGRRRV
jgi:hypothetical protein